MMVFNELPAIINVTVYVPVLHNASPSGCLLPFQGRVSLVLWRPRYVGRYLRELGMPSLTMQEEALTKGTSCLSQ